MDLFLGFARAAFGVVWNSSGHKDSKISRTILEDRGDLAAHSNFIRLRTSEFFYICEFRHARETHIIEPEDSQAIVAARDAISES